MGRQKTFKLSDAVGTLRVDLRTDETPNGYVGTIPEPSGQKVNDWKANLSQQAAENGYRGDPNDTVALAEFLADMDAEDLNQQDERTAEIYAELCSDCPSAEQLMEMPSRHRAAFYGYIAGQFQGEAQTPAGAS